MGTTTEEINELLDLNPTTFLKNSKTQVYFNSKSKFKGYAIVEIFSYIAEEFLTLNSFTYKSKKLTIEIAKNLPKSKTDEYPSVQLLGNTKGKG